MGGGIFVDSGTVSVADSTFEGNGASMGGGIFVDSGTVSVADSTFEGNSAANGGGISNDGTLTVTNSTLTDNDANRGGGIANYGVLTSSTPRSSTTRRTLKAGESIPSLQALNAYHNASQHDRGRQPARAKVSPDDIPGRMSKTLAPTT